jgi:hypothetical protein
LKGERKAYMPKTADESKGRLSETKITDFSSMIEYSISKKVSGARAERNMVESQNIEERWSSRDVRGILI